MLVMFPKASKNLEIELDQVFCARHGELLRKHFRPAYEVFACHALSVLLKKDEYKELCQGDPEKLPDLLLEKPLCCRLSSSELLDAYLMLQARLGLWDVGQCSLCLGRALGAPWTPYDGRDIPLVGIPFVCLYCVVFRFDQLFR